MGRKRLTTEEFIEKARKVHGDKYEYDEVEYKNSDTKVKIFCNKHQMYFYQTPSNHLRGRGCPECKKQLLREIYTSNTQEFIEKAMKIHGDKYGYEDVNYTGSKNKVKIFCNNCQIYFWQLPTNHLSGEGCPKCKTNILRKIFSSNTQNFIAKARKVHGNKYDYGEVEYKNNVTKVKLFCNSCQKYFWQTPNVHLTGHGCPECMKISFQKAYSSNTQNFIAKARKVHGNKYDYGEVEYKNNFTKVKLFCNSCQKYFWQTPNSHLNEHGCPHCNNSKLETITSDFLLSHNIPFHQEYNTKNFDKNYRNLRLDFYIPKLKVGIECQGEQHFRPVDFTSKMPLEQVQKQFEQIQLRDRLKKQYCEENGIKLYYMTKKEDLQDLYERRLIY